MPVTSWASAIDRRSSKTDGENLLSFIQFARQIQYRAGRQTLEVGRLKRAQGVERLARLVNQQPNQAFFRLGDLAQARQLAAAGALAAAT